MQGNLAPKVIESADSSDQIEAGAGDDGSEHALILDSEVVAHSTETLFAVERKCLRREKINARVQCS